MLTSTHLKHYTLLAGQLAALLLCFSIQAEPRVPTDSDEILASVPISRTPVASKVSATEAETLIANYIHEFRQQDDPRYLGRAKGVLERFSAGKLKPLPTSILLLRASIFESEHQFKAALEDLKSVTESEPRNAQAWLNQATIFRLQGKYEQSIESCKKVVTLGQRNLGVSCQLLTQSLNGDAARSYSGIKRLAHNSRDTDTLSWYQSMLGDIAVRLGKNELAEKHYRQSVQLSPGRGYARRELADLLLAEQRPADALALLSGKQPSDALLLRIALAKQQTGDSYSVETNELTRRYAAATRRGDNTHSRDQALFELQIANHPEAALKLAQQNWTNQREPVDLLTLVKAATAAGDSNTLNEAKNWFNDNQFQDNRTNTVLFGGHQ